MILNTSPRRPHDIVALGTPDVTLQPPFTGTFSQKIAMPKMAFTAASRPSWKDPMLGFPDIKRKRLNVSDNSS
jgi:hypothetical protein